MNFLFHPASEVKMTSLDRLNVSFDIAYRINVA